jgi:hypothetical protein
MNLAAIIREATAGGVNLALTSAGTLKATGEAEAVNRWLPTIRQHKPGILAALRAAANKSNPRDCHECTHVTRRGGCGEPVLAGLSPVEGVIRYGNADLCEAFEERAAIMEYDGGLSRDEAERLAAESMGVGA